MKRSHAMPFGAELRADGTTRFRLWAPGIAQVDLETENAGGRALRAMQAVAGGFHELTVADAPAGTRYRFHVAEDLAVPDPASRANPLDVHGPSEVIDASAYTWGDAHWRGRPWREAVLYELHVGTFTAEGTFAAAAERLPELASDGITALELMPVADFPGHRNWGYDGVLPFAPDAAYGRPDDLKSFIDRAHSLGLMVLLDVVYNHFGPEGNYLHAYAPEFFNPAHQTPWGAAINFDGEHARTVREFFIHNALYWIGEYHFDGLRLDAIHAIRDDSTPHIVEELARAVREAPARDRHVHIVLENELNQSHHLAREADGSPRLATAQWNDDVHHALHVLVTGERDGYYIDYAEDPLTQLGRALAEGFVYQDDPSGFRGGERRGEPSAHLPPGAFVNFLQTHDQVGNRAFGERIHALADTRLERAALACLLLAPQPPMFFMGEEYAASTPFQFFCDFGPELAEAVSRGRRAEFARFAAFSDPAARERIPDPSDPATFQRSRLDWSERTRGAHAERLSLVRELLAVRQRDVAPRVPLAGGDARYLTDGPMLQVDWTLADTSRLHLLAHFGRDGTRAASLPPGRVLHASRPADLLRSGGLAPGDVIVTLETGDE